MRKLRLLPLALAVALPVHVAAQDKGEPPRESPEEIRRRADMLAALKLAVAEARKRRGVRVPRGEETPVPIPLALFEKLAPEYFSYEKEVGVFDTLYSAGSSTTLYFTERPGGAARLERAGAKLESIYDVWIQACELRSEQLRKIAPEPCDEKGGFTGLLQIWVPRGKKILQDVRSLEFEVFPDGRGGWRLFMEDAYVGNVR